jgi:Mn-dependent DtxR family transcriptional regulator
MDEGYILSNKYRKIIFDRIASGETNIIIIAKRHHLVPNIVKRIVDEFVKEGIVERNKKGYVLTKNGEKIAENIR